MSSPLLRIARSANFFNPTGKPSLRVIVAKL